MTNWLWSESNGVGRVRSKVYMACSPLLVGSKSIRETCSGIGEGLNLIVLLEVESSVESTSNPLK